MSTRHSDNDGSDIFWPGYVDAVTNLVLNLLFLLTIMTVAVFMFALELGRASHSGQGKPPVAAAGKHEVENPAKTSADQLKENIALKREIEELNKKLNQQAKQLGQAERGAKMASAPHTAPPERTQHNTVQPGPLAASPGQTGTVDLAGQTGKADIARLNAKANLGGQTAKTFPAGQMQSPESLVSAGEVEKTVEVTSRIARPQNGLDKTLPSDLGIIVRFMDDAVAFTTAEHDLLLESLRPIAASGKANIHVEVPAGFSEAKRMGFYRAMAVRNLLIEMKVPTEKIEVSVLEGKGNANASLVRVK